MCNRLLHDWWQLRYLPLAPYDSQLLHNDIQFQHYRQFLDDYVYAESEHYMSSLFQYD